MGLRERFLTWAINRMVGAVLADNERKTGAVSGHYNLNPEDWDNVAYVMLCGLVGVKPRD